MDDNPECITWRTLAGFLVLGAVIGVLAAPIAAMVESGHRPLVIRLAVALFAAIVCCRLIVAIREAAMIGQMSSADVALQPRAAPAQVDPLLARLTAEARAGFGQRFIPPSLSERLRRIGERRSVVAPAAPTARLTWHDAEQMIDAIEDA